MLSPFVTGTLSKASAKYLSSIGGIDSNGATTTFSAGGALIFLIVTVSLMATPELFLIKPSILITPLPSSDGYNGRHLATVFRFPLISIISPVEASKTSIAS